MSSAFDECMGIVRIAFAMPGWIKVKCVPQELANELCLLGALIRQALGVDISGWTA